MIRPTVKHSLEIAAGIVAVIGSLAALGAWLIASGPLSLDLVAPNIRDSFNRNLVGYRVEFEAANLHWFSQLGVFDVRVSDVHIFNAADELIADVPEMDLRFGAGSILRGDPSPSRVEMVGASAVVIRRANGEFQLGLESPAGEAANDSLDDEIGQPPQASDFVGSLINSVFDSREQGVASSAIEDFAIRDASLTIHDEPTGSVWEASDALIEFTQFDQRGVGRLEATIDVQGTPVSIWLDGKRDLSSGGTSIHVEFSDVAPATLAQKFGGSTLFERLTSPVSGEMNFELTPDGSLDVGQAAVRASAGKIDLSDIVLHGEDEVPPEGEPEWVLNAPPDSQASEPPALDSVQIDGAVLEASWHPESQRIVIDQLAVYGPQNDITFVGGITTVMQDDQPFVPARVSLDMQAQDSAFFVVGIVEDQLHFDDISFSLTFDLLKRHLVVENVSFAAYGGSARVSGLISEGFTDVGALSPTIELSGEMNDVPIAAVARIWPVFTGTGARDWIKGNVSRGEISRGDLVVSIDEGMLAESNLPPEAIQLDFSFDNVDADYIPGLTPITNAAGSAKLFSNSVVLKVPKAAIGNLVVTNGVVDIPRFVPKGAVAKFTLTVAGDAREILDLIDMEPLALTSEFGLEPENVSGDAIVTLTVGRPMRRYVPAEIITYDAVAEGRNLTLVSGIGDLPLTNGEMSINVTNSGIEGDGAIDIAGVPSDFEWREVFDAKDDLSTNYVIDIETDASRLYKLGLEAEPFLQGPVIAKIRTTGSGFEFNSAEVELNLSQTAVDFSVFDWKKERGATASSSFHIDFTEDGTNLVRGFRLTGDEVDVAGEFELAQNLRLMSASFPTIRMGDSMDLSLDSSRLADEDRLVLNLSGKKFFGGVLLKEFIFAPGGEASAPTTIDADLDIIRLNNGVTLQDVSLNFSTKDGFLTTCDVDAGYEDGGGISVALSATPNRRRQLTISSTDGGSVIRALTDTTGVIGGAMKLSMEMEGVAAGPVNSEAAAGSEEETAELGGAGKIGGLDFAAGAQAAEVADAPEATYGVVTLEEFRVVDLPASARLLSAASLSGVRDLMNGDGLWFDQLEVPFVLDGRKIELSDASASGPSIGVTLEGYYDQDEEELDVAGTLVPAYSVNTVLGNVPVLGDLFVSRKGEGVLGLTYRIQGQPEVARVFVNPLSALAPGFLRRLFQVGEPEVSERPDSVILPTVPQSGEADGASPQSEAGTAVNVPSDVVVE